MNVNEYGIQLQFGTSFNMSSYTSLRLVFTPPTGATFTRTPTLGTSPITTTAGSFAANTYVTYTFIQGDITQTGTYTVRLIYQDAAPTYLTSSVGSFVVSA